MKLKNILLSHILMLTSTVKVNSQTCDFEDDFCGWEKGSLSDGQWERGSYTPSINTGPESAYKGKMFAYMNVGDYKDSITKIVHAGKKVVLVSPILSTNFSSVCFQFYYYMYGKAVSNLTVGTVNVNQEEESKHEIFHETGDQGQIWHCRQFTVSPTPTKRIYIQAITGPNIQSDIAIDHLTLIPSRCGTGGECIVQTANITNNGSITSEKDITTSIININTRRSGAGKTDDNNTDDNILLFAILIPVVLLIIVAILAVIFYKKNKKLETLDILDNNQYQNTQYDKPEEEYDVIEEPRREDLNCDYDYVNENSGDEHPHNTADVPPPLPSLVSRMQSI